MDYNLKIVMNGVEVLEDTGKTTMGGVTYDTPSITNVMLQNSASLGAMDIGTTASDKLTFTMRNPYKQSFDGGVLEFWIAENPNGIETTLNKIADEVGTDTTTEGIDITQNTSNLIEDEEEGEALTEEELADVTEVQDVNEEDLFIQLEGETDTTQADETIETGWQQVGVYYVMGQTNNPDGSITITAYDGFCKLNGFYNPATPTDTVQNLFNELRDKALEECGIVIDEFDFDDIADEVVTLNVLTTYRGALGYFAGLVGGFAEFDEDGTVCISFYSFSSNELIKSELLAYSEDSAGEMVLQELTCNTVVNGTEEITVGAGQGVSFTNPMMNESMLEKVLATYNGMRFVGGNISAIWDRSLMAGRFIRIFTEEEYANYLALLNQIEITTDETELKGLKANANALGSIMLICSQVIDFRGNATTRITSGNGTEASKVNALTPPLIQKVMEAGKTATNYLSQDSTGALVVASLQDGANVRIDSDSVDIRNNDEVLASFGEVTRIGDWSESNVRISQYGIDIGYGVHSTLDVYNNIEMHNGEVITEYGIGEEIGTNISGETYERTYYTLTPKYENITKVWSIRQGNGEYIESFEVEVSYIKLENEPIMPCTVSYDSAEGHVGLPLDLTIDGRKVGNGSRFNTDDIHIVDEWRTWNNGTNYLQFRKWSNGYTEVWADIVKASVPCTTAAFGGYRSADLTTSFATWLKSISYFVADVQNASGGGYTMHMRTLKSGASLSTMVLNSTNATKTNVHIVYYILGQSAD